MKTKTKSAVRNRKKAAILVGFGAITAVAAALLLLKRATRPGGPEPPWPLPDLVAEDADGAPWRFRADLPKPAAFIYATHTCPQCRHELSLWSDMINDGVRANVWVIAAAQSKTDGMAWVPQALRHRTVADTDSSIARTLSVRYVPATFWVDGTDSVRVVRIGRSTRPQMLAAMEKVGMTR